LWIEVCVRHLGHLMQHQLASQLAMRRLAAVVLHEATTGSWTENAAARRIG
jgi:hypothetical protein